MLNQGYKKKRGSEMQNQSTEKLVYPYQIHVSEKLTHHRQNFLTKEKECHLELKEAGPGLQPWVSVAGMSAGFASRDSHRHAWSPSQFSEFERKMTLFGDYEKACGHLTLPQAALLYQSIPGHSARDSWWSIVHFTYLILTECEQTCYNYSPPLNG